MDINHSDDYEAYCPEWEEYLSHTYSYEPEREEDEELLTLTDDELDARIISSLSATDLPF